MSERPDGDALGPPSPIAFIGLGQMGRPMAARLAAAGYRVRAFDSAAAQRAGFVEAAGGAAVAASAAAAAAGAEAVVTMLPDGRIVRDVLLGGGAAARAMAEGSVVVDMSSSSPLDTRATGEALAELGIDMVDAPVSGGVKRAVDGTLAVMAGGRPASVRRLTPLLKVVGASVFATGPLGSGHAMKALNNFVSAAGLVAAAEALLIGRRFGLDPRLMVDVLNASTGRNNSTENKLTQQVLSGAYASGFALGLMAKDLETAAALARDAGVGTPLAGAQARLWREAEAALGDGADHTEIFRYLEGLAGEGRR
jgi:3-hydroxyisobutyrate dehydrogenase